MEYGVFYPYQDGSGYEIRFTQCGMQLIPNPGDGIVNCVADCFSKELGFCKNCVDAFCVVCALAIGLVFGNPLMGVGLGTVLSMIGVGRVIYFFNRITKARLQKLAGLEASN